MARFREVLKERNFFLLWLGQIISQFGDRLNQMVLIAIVYARTPGSPFELAKFFSFTIIPSFFVSPLAGAFIDRWDKKTTMIVCDVLRGLVVLAIPLLFADVQAGLLARPGLTIHLYSGGLDAYSPLEIFREETGALGGAVVYKNLPGTGHDGYYLEPEIWDDLWAAEGAAPPGSGAPRIK